MTKKKNNNIIIKHIFQYNKRKKSLVYCGGLSHKDVTAHNLKLQSDGYYVCSKCGYRIKTPDLQDKEILNEEDYSLLISAKRYYTQNTLLAKQNTTAKYIYESEAHNTKILIDTIRSKNQYATQYDYKGPDGKYYAPEIDQSLLAFLNNATINSVTMGLI